MIRRTTVELKKMQKDFDLQKKEMVGQSSQRGGKGPGILAQTCKKKKDLRTQKQIKSWRVRNILKNCSMKGNTNNYTYIYI